MNGSELSGGLIQMTAHMVVRGWPKAMIIGGGIAAGLFAALAILAKVGKRGSWRYAVFFAALALTGVIIAITGAKQPRQKIVMACASGPVSLEMVATKYDIIEVDGKLLKLAER